MSLPKGIVICPACGTRTRPAARRVPCEETVQCKARVVHLQYEARGWVAASNSTAGKILEESGAPVEWAPAGVHVEQRDKGRRGRHGEVLYDDEWVNHPIAFTPKSAFRAVAALTRVQRPADFRRRAIGALWQRPDLLDALDALKRLRGGVSKSHVWALTDHLTSSQVVDDRIARTRYPYLSKSHELLYPGKLVPLWAVEVVGVFERAGYMRFGQRLGRVLKRVRNDARRAELVRALATLVSLRPDGLVGQDPDLPRRVLELVSLYFAEHGIKPITDEESVDLDVAMLT